MERTIRVIGHVTGPLKDTIVEVIEDDGGSLRLVARELHVSFEGDGTGTVKDITPLDAGRRLPDRVPSDGVVAARPATGPIWELSTYAMGSGWETVD